jgi:hypothetical protein
VPGRKPRLFAGREGLSGRQTRSERRRPPARRRPSGRGGNARRSSASRRPTKERRPSGSLNSARSSFVSAGEAPRRTRACALQSVIRRSATTMLRERPGGMRPRTRQTSHFSAMFRPWASGRSAAKFPAQALSGCTRSFRIDPLRHPCDKPAAPCTRSIAGNRRRSR